jgi:hypothetical protein
LIDLLKWTDRPFRVTVEMSGGKEATVALLLVVLLVALLLGGLGFAAHVLWILALVVLAVWVLGFLLRGPAGSGRRWYRW